MSPTIWSSPVRSSTTRRRSHIVTFRSIYSKEWREQSHIIEKVQYFLSMQADTKKHEPMGKRVRDQFGKSNKSHCCACCMEKRENNAASKTDQREWPPQRTEKRGSDCSVRRSQSISSPSRDHGAANEPGDCLSTTHRDKRVRTKPPAEWETAQTNRFKWVDGYKKTKDTKDLKKK